MAAEVPESKVGRGRSQPAGEDRACPTSKTLNKAVGALIDKLRFASGLPAGEAHGRHSAVVALRAAWGFLMRFESVQAQTLHVPLLSLSSALVALNENNTEPMIKPTKRRGRAPSSPRHYVLVGIAVGAANGSNG